MNQKNTVQRGGTLKICSLTGMDRSTRPVVGHGKGSNKGIRYKKRMPTNTNSKEKPPGNQNHHQKNCGTVYLKMRQGVILGLQAANLLRIGFRFYFRRFFGRGIFIATDGNSKDCF